MCLGLYGHPVQFLLLG